MGKGHSRASSFSERESPFSMARALLYAVLLFTLAWVMLEYRGYTSSEALRTTVKDSAKQLVGVWDEQLYGTRPPPRQPVRPRPKTSTLDSLKEWGVGPVPTTRIRAMAHAGWSLFDNVYLQNGTIFLVTNDPKSFPELRLIFSPGVEMSNDPASWRGREITSKDIQIISPAEAHNLFGQFASRIEGTTFFCNDDKQFVSHYYHFLAEVLFGLWRTYSTLDPNISSNGSTILDPPRRFMFPRLNQTQFKDYSGLAHFVSRAVLPSMSFQFSNRWADLEENGKPYVFDRLVIGDRITAERAPEWPHLYKYIAPAFSLPASEHWWMPMRKNLVQFLEQSDSSVFAKKKKKEVITYVSRQGWGRRALRSEDDAVLVRALKHLEERHGYEVNVAFMDKMSMEEQLVLAVRSTVMIGVHGNGLTHALWMDPAVKPVLMEFFYPDGFATDYMYPMRQLGIKYYGWWNNKYFDTEQLPEPGFPDKFHSNEIPIDGKAVAQLIHKHIQSRGSGV